MAEILQRQLSSPKILEQGTHSTTTKKTVTSGNFHVGSSHGDSSLSTSCESREHGNSSHGHDMHHDLQHGRSLDDTLHGSRSHGNSHQTAYLCRSNIGNFNHIKREVKIREDDIRSNSSTTSIDNESDVSKKSTTKSVSSERLASRKPPHQLRTMQSVDSFLITRVDDEHLKHKVIDSGKGKRQSNRSSNRIEKTTSLIGETEMEIRDDLNLILPTNQKASRVDKNQIARNEFEQKSTCKNYLEEHLSVDEPYEKESGYQPSKSPSNNKKCFATPEQTGNSFTPYISEVSPGNLSSVKELSSRDVENQQRCLHYAVSPANTEPNIAVQSNPGTKKFQRSLSKPEVVGKVPIVRTIVEEDELDVSNSSEGCSTKSHIATEKMQNVHSRRIKNPKRSKILRSLSEANNIGNCSVSVISE